MDSSSVYLAFLGGSLIGLAAIALLFFNGRILGISGIVSGLLQPSRGEALWRVLFVGGLVSGGVMLLATRPEMLPSSFDRSLPVLALAGLLVGFGARLGSGCTSGHGICGVGRLAPRSLVATVTFTASGALAVLIVSLFFGGSI